MITNKQLKQASRQLFTYSAYQAPFFGRERSIREMGEKTAALRPGEALLISQPLGTGKTFLVSHMISNRRLPIPNGATFLTARAVADRPESMEAFPGDVLVMDEADIKTTYAKLRTSLTELKRYLDRTGKRAIVIGDFALRNAELRACLGQPKQIEEFEPLDEGFLRGVLNKRFGIFLKKEVGEDFQLEDVIAPDLLRAFTGEWIWPVNNFRGIFSLLQSVTDDDNLVRFNSNPARLELSMVMERLVSEEDELDTAEQEDFLNLLRAYIREVYPLGSGLTRGFELSELYTLAEQGNLGVDYEDFADDILYPLAQAGYLISTGIPYYREGAFIRRPLPMVPSLRLLLSAR